MGNLLWMASDEIGQNSLRGVSRSVDPAIPPANEVEDGADLGWGHLALPRQLADLTLLREILDRDLPVLRREDAPRLEQRRHQRVSQAGAQAVHLPADRSGGPIQNARDLPYAQIFLIRQFDEQLILRRQRPGAAKQHLVGVRFDRSLLFGELLVQTKRPIE